MPRRSLDALAREVEEAARLRHQADLAGLEATLAGLLEDCGLPTHILNGSERAFWLLGEAYCAAWQVVYKLGYLDLASLTEDRYEWAAARSGDREGADAHLAEARETAERIGVDRDDYRMFFGPTNVAIWSVGLAVEPRTARALNCRCARCCDRWRRRGELLPGHPCSVGRLCQDMTPTEGGRRADR